MALYHKHRPQSFHDIAGQLHIVQTITNQIKSNKISHAYLFSGPRGVGKTTLARVFAKSINCKKMDGSEFEPDNTTQDAIEITSGRSIDVIEIDAASNTGVDNVRENIIENVQFRPTKLPYKVFIIDEVHMLSTSAFNALLKTLEEPPKHAIFILATTEIHKLPKTIVSRCQVFQFEKLSFPVLKEYLLKIAKEEDITLEDALLDAIIYKSDGCARDAINLLDQMMSTGEKNITFDIASALLPSASKNDILKLLFSLSQKDLRESVEAIHALQAQNIHVNFAFEESITILRHALLLSINQNDSEYIKLEYEQTALSLLTQIVDHLSRQDMICLLDLLLKRKTETKTAPIPYLPLEILAVEWCEPVTTKTKPPEIQTPVPKKTESKIEKLVHKVEEKVEEIVASPPPDKIEPLSSQPSSVLLSDVQKKWPEFLKLVEKEAPSLCFILQNSEILSLENNTIQVSVEYAFHRDKIEQVQTKQKLEKALAEAIGATLYIEPQVLMKDAEKQKKELDGLANLIGGEVL